jgi:NADH dehydrogenase
MPSFLAMFAKHFINIIYFIQVLGWNKIFNYAKHEFFTIRNCRSFVGGHFSNRTPSFLLVPLRVWLGAVWLFEGVMKIVEGWFKSPKLTGFFGGADSWYNTILNGASGAPATDATSSATVSSVDTIAKAVTVVSKSVKAIATTADAASSATVDPGAAAGAGDQAVQAIGHVLVNFDFLGLFRVIFISGKDLAHSTLTDYAFKLDIPLMDWFVKHVILPTDGMQMFMQVFIVLAEILIGLALMGGLFTTPAAAFSLVLQIMFVCTTGLYLGTFWMIFGAVAVLIGAGRTLGLDYYAMPALKKGWKKLPFVRKWYLYND